MNPDLLRRVTACTSERADLFAAPLSAACAFYGITTPERLAAFLAQIGHESGSLRYTSEIWGPTPAQLRYEGRADLGNTQPGDGERFKGHGLIQTTGRHNHVRVRDRLRERFPDVPDFEAEPERLAEPQWAALSAADYWDDHGLNALADAGRFVAIGRAINRGNAKSSLPANGEQDRLARWERAKLALSQETAVTSQVQESAQPIPQETTMSPIVLPLVMGLARNLMDVFTPLAREKLTKEMDRHTDNPEVAGQIATSIIDTAKALTGKSDPVEAVAAAKAEPEIVQQVEAGALETLDRLGPILDKMAQWDRETWAAEEASRDAAAARRKLDDYDMTKPLLFGSMAMVAVLIVFVGAVAVAQLVMTGEVKTEIWAALTGLIGWATAKAGSIYDYRFGTSRSSGAKDVVIGELSKRKP